MASDLSLFNTVLVWTYNVLLACIPLFVILSLAQLVVAIAHWRSEKRTKRLIRAGVLFVAAALLPLVLFGLWRGVIRPSMAAEMTAQHRLETEERNAESSILRIGNEITAIDQLLENVGIPQDEAEILVLNFFATWCGPCLAELPHLQRIADKYSDQKDISFVVIGREETQETLDAFAANNTYRIPFIADPERSLYSEFAKELIPRTYLIDSQRRIRFEIIGFDEEKLEELDTKIGEIAKELTNDR